MAPQEETPQQPDWTRRFREDPSALEVPPFSQPPLPPLLIITSSGISSLDRLPTVEPRRVEMDWEGELPSIEDQWTSQSGG
jgi:hypothetical protein